MCLDVFRGRGDWESLWETIVPAVAIDELSRALRMGWTNAHYDLNQDGAVNQADREFWVRSIAQTTFGDANLDGHFDSRRLSRRVPCRPIRGCPTGKLVVVDRRLEWRW